MPAPKTQTQYEQEIETRIARLEQRLGTVLRGTGLSSPGPNQIAVDGEFRAAAFDGDLATKNAGSKGWALNDQVAAFGELILRPGSLGNDLLTSPILPDTADVRVKNFTVPASTYALLGTVAKPVPPGYSRLLVSASGWMFARNPNTTGGVDGAGTDAIYCFVRVVGSTGDSDSDPYGQGISGFGGFTTATSGVSDIKTGLAGSVQFNIYGASSMQALPAHTQNSATLSATLLWIR